MDKDNTIPPPCLEMFNDYIGQEMGLDFKNNRWQELERGIREAAPELGFDSPEKCIRHLMASGLSKKQVEILSAHLTVVETYFFRETESFDILESHILPQIIAAAGEKPRPLRIWSAACSTGEEPYSIAIVLDRHKKILKDWPVTILATDINRNSLEKARTGIYGEWSLRSTPTWVRLEYFTRKEKNSFALKPHIKEMVQFAYHNLAEDSYPSLLNNTNGMDIIFCRNVLMYFLARKAEEVIRRFYHSLVPWGWLIAAATDSFQVVNVECFVGYAESASVFSKCPEKIDPPLLPVSRNLKRAIRQRNRPGIKTSPAAAVSAPAGPEVETPVNETYIEALGLYMQGNYAQSAGKLREVLDREKNPVPAAARGDMFALLARSYANLGQLDHALQWCRKAIAADKLNPDYHYLQAAVLQERGSEDDAARALHRCLYIDRDFLLAHFALANIIQRKNRHHNTESRKHLEIALSLLKSFGDQDVVSIEEGLAAGRLREIIKTSLEKESAHAG